MTQYRLWPCLFTTMSSDACPDCDYSWRWGSKVNLAAGNWTAGLYSDWWTQLLRAAQNNKSVLHPSRGSPQSCARCSCMSNQAYLGSGSPIFDYPTVKWWSPTCLRCSNYCYCGCCHCSLLSNTMSQSCASNLRKVSAASFSVLGIVGFSFKKSTLKELRLWLMKLHENL